MEYTIMQLATLSGISTRTLRYYDEIGLLKPAFINESGYRIYGQAEVDRLQEIRFFKELGMNLRGIRDALTAPSYERLIILTDHRELLLAKKLSLYLLIENVENSIAEAMGVLTMTDKEKFSGFKQKLIQENEKKYGVEIRERFGEEQVEKANQNLSAMSQEQYSEMERLGCEVLSLLKDAVNTGDPAGEAAQKTADLHKKWLTYTWGNYLPEAHAGLAQMYVDDERFSAYYDQVCPGAAVFLRDAILIYTGKYKSE